MARGRARIEDHHAEWLSLVETSGPFLTVPALKRALPDGLDATPAALPDLRVAFAEWRQDHRLQQRWVRWVLDEILELRDAVHEATDADPSHLVAEQSVTLRPSYVVRDHTRDGSPAVLLVHRVEAGTALDRPIPLGEYAATADFESFLQRRGDGGIRNDIARLAGGRMVVSVEVEDGKRLAEGLIKQLTGGDKIAARFLHREYFEFEPQFTLWLVANARPRAHADDDALWRRILQIPFTEVIPAAERDPELKRALRTNPAEQIAILAWLVHGCLEWQEHGLAVPERVRNYTEEYRQENDPLAEWIADECQLGAEHWTAARDLRAIRTVVRERRRQTARRRPSLGRRPQSPRMHPQPPPKRPRLARHHTHPRDPVTPVTSESYTSPYARGAIELPLVGFPSECSRSGFIGFSG
jgi:hypothetical protein